VVLLDISELSVIADYFVICTGSNPRQIQAIASAIEDALNEARVSTRGREGPMEREYYRLERLWSEAPTVVYLQ